MSLFLDLKYINLISPRFESFVKKKDFLYACRCPICGDSRKNKSKMRGYIFRKGNGLFYKCHNCGIGLSAGNLIRQLDEGMHKKYVLERYSQGEGGNSNFKEPEFKFKSVRFGSVEEKQYENAVSISELPAEHYCVQYLNNRRIPKEFYSDIFFTQKFKSFVEEIYPDNDANLYDESRVVVLYKNQFNVVEGLSARSLGDASKLRYIKLNFSGEDKIYYGKNRVDTSKPVRIVEGAFDSMFLHNCLASGDSALMTVAEDVSAKEKILIYDNEPRNSQIVQLMEKAINKGYTVVIWPDFIVGKDINEMLLNGFNIDLVENIIRENAYSGLKAKLKFTAWRKC